jgi:hypothetical protein
MMIWNYQLLCAEIAEYLGRDDLADRIPVFIALAEHAMRNELRLKCLERAGWIETQAGESVVALPDKRIQGDWDVFLEMRKLALAGPVSSFASQNRAARVGSLADTAGMMTGLEYVTPDLFAGLADMAGRPAAFTVLGRELHLAPAPDGVYRLLMSYWADIPPLGPEQPTNDLLINHPRLYLYGALAESSAYTRDTGPAAQWLTHYQNEKIEAEYRQERARFGKQISARSPRAV